MHVKDIYNINDDNWYNPLGGCFYSELSGGLYIISGLPELTLEDKEYSIVVADFKNGEFLNEEIITGKVRRWSSYFLNRVECFSYTLFPTSIIPISGALTSTWTNETKWINYARGLMKDKIDLLSLL